MGWIGETVDSIKSLQIRQVLTQAVSLGSLPIFQSFFFLLLIRVWNWNCTCFLMSLGDNKLWVCIKNWSFIDFFFSFLLGFLLRLKRTKPNCLLRLMWFCLAHLNWDFQVLYFLGNRNKIKFHIHNHCLYGGLGDNSCPQNKVMSFLFIF